MGPGVTIFPSLLPSASPIIVIYNVDAQMANSGMFKDPGPVGLSNTFFGKEACISTFSPHAYT